MEMINTLEDVAYELMWKGERAKEIGRLAKDDELNDFLLNQRLDHEWEMHQYLNR